MSGVRRGGLIAAGLAAVLVAGLVQAQTAPPPAAPPQPQAPPPEDPIAEALRAQEEASAEEEAPPAPGEITPQAAPEPRAVAEPDPPARKADEEAEEAVVAEPEALPEDQPLRVRHGSAIMQAVDKITAERLRFEVKVGQPTRYKGLVFTVRACETNASDEPMADSVAWMEVRAEPRTQTEDTPSRRIFRGWMYARSPSLNPLEHPVYDAWLIACRDSRPVAVGASR